MEHIEITGDKLHEIMDGMEPEARRIFEKLLLQASSSMPIKSIKKWLENFEDDCPVDNLIARIVMQVINEVGRQIWDEMKAVKESGAPNYSGHQAAVVAIREVRKIADQLEVHLTHENCVKCAGEGVTH